MLEVRAVAKLNLSSMLEAFALAAGIPPSAWQTVPRRTVEMASPQARIQGVTLKSNVEYLHLPLVGHTEAGDRNE
jgi:hypothetical protein